MGNKLNFEALILSIPEDSIVAKINQWYCTAKNNQWTVQKLNNVDRTHLLPQDSATENFFTLISEVFKLKNK